MKKKKMEKKKRRRVRTKNWEENHEFSFTHDLVKHRRASVKLRQRPEQENPLPTDFEANGAVIGHSKKWAFVQLEDGERLCIIDERLQEQRRTLLAPGDRVLVEFEEDEAIVRGVAPRRTKLCRPGHEDSRLEEQILAANIDLLIVVAAAEQPPFRVGLIDRFLIAAEVGGVEPILCLNKMDLVDAEPEAVKLYREFGVRVFPTSCVDGSGFDALRERLRGKTSVLAGHSGVGKSSLLNHIDADLRILTQEVSPSSQRGRHTTTASRLYLLANDIRIIDTPGIRALGLWGVSPEEVAYYFPELADIAVQCRFRNCTHLHEPHCAVRDAVEAGTIPAPRFDSYTRIRASLEAEDGHTPGRISTQSDNARKNVEKENL
jgi:ribosome biogenesis GTPase / thiamine phosphate phosphatase